jgi:hypothetical protein
MVGLLRRLGQGVGDQGAYLGELDQEAVVAVWGLDGVERFG